MRSMFTAVVLGAVLVVGCKDESKKEAVTTAASAVAPITKPAEPTGITFTKKAPTVGMKWERVANMKMTLEMGPGKKMDITNTENSTETVKALNGDAISEMDVVYGTAEMSMAGMGTQKEPVAGKSYTIKSDGTKTTVTSGGKPAVAIEASTVEKTFKNTVGKPDPFAAAIPTRSLKAGETVPELTSALTEVLSGSGDKDTKVTDVAVTLRDVKDGIATFDTTGKLLGKMMKAEMTVNLKGEMQVRTADSMWTGMKLTGPIAISEGKNNGTGTMEVTMTRKF